MGEGEGPFVSPPRAPPPVPRVPPRSGGRSSSLVVMHGQPNPPNVMGLISVLDLSGCQTKGEVPAPPGGGAIFFLAEKVDELRGERRSGGRESGPAGWGLAMVGHLLRGGFEVCVHDVSADAATKAADLGPSLAATPGDVARQAAVVFIAVGFDAETRKRSCRGAEGLFGRRAAGRHADRRVLDR